MFERLQFAIGSEMRKKFSILWISGGLVIINVM